VFKIRFLSGFKATMSSGVQFLVCCCSICRVAVFLPFDKRRGALLEWPYLRPYAFDLALQISKHYANVDRCIAKPI